MLYKKPIRLLCFLSTIYCKTWTFCELLYKINSWMEFQNRLPTGHVSWAIVPNALTWFLKELLTTLWGPWKAFYLKKILLGLHMVSVFILSTFYWQCIFVSIVNFRNIYHPLKKMICITATSLAVKTSTSVLLICLLTSSFVFQIRAIWNWSDSNTIYSEELEQAATCASKPFLLYLVYSVLTKHALLYPKDHYKLYCIFHFLNKS